MLLDLQKQVRVYLLRADSSFLGFRRQFPSSAGKLSRSPRLSGRRAEGGPLEPGVLLDGGKKQLISKCRYLETRRMKAVKYR